MKKMLLICAKAYKYDVQIKNEFEQQGYKVDLFSDRPSDSFFSKLLLRISRFMCLFPIFTYQSHLLKKCEEEKYDIVLVIEGQCFFSSFFKKLKRKNPNTTFVYYLWDSVSTFPYFKANFPYFDFVFTFDFNDSVKYKLQFLPLFFSNVYRMDSKQIISPKYDYVYIATAKQNKIRPFVKIKKELETWGYLNGFQYIYIQSRLILLYFRFRYPEFRLINFNEYKFKRLGYEEAAAIIKESRIVIDSPQKGQAGLTMRTMEAIASHKKIITTNENIKKYDFYSPKSIHVIGDKIDSAFFDSCDYYNDSIIEKYSIKNWCISVIPKIKG